MEDKANVRHPKYDKLQRLRTIFSDVCEGTAKMRTVKEYLPMFPAETTESYNLRQTTATLLNVTVKTKESLCGLVFHSDLTLKSGEDEVSKETMALAESIDNKGNHINVFAQALFDASFDGYAAILVDAPMSQAGDLAEERKLGIRPYMTAYNAASIINWDYEINEVSKRRELSLIVFMETATVKTGMFTRKEEVRYRVFWKDGTTVKWQLWRVKEGKGEGEVLEQVEGQGGVIASQDQIPVAIVGELGDQPPLMDLTYKNIEHFQTYSDYKSIIHKTCVPLLWTVNLEGEPTAIGSDVWWKLGAEGSMGFAEVSGTSIEKVKASLDDMEAHMAKLGLAMLESKQIETTATETTLDSIQETSALQVRATQLKDALEQAWIFVNKYRKSDESISVELGAMWAQMVLAPEELKALSSLVDLGQMSLESMLWHLLKAGKLPPDATVESELKLIQKAEDEAIEKDAVLMAKAMPSGEINNGKKETTAKLPNA